VPPWRVAGQLYFLKVVYCKYLTGLVEGSAASFREGSEKSVMSHSKKQFFGNLNK
jgi:hypothetical protein